MDIHLAQNGFIWMCCSWNRHACRRDNGEGWQRKTWLNCFNENEKHTNSPPFSQNDTEVDLYHVGSSTNQIAEHSVARMLMMLYVVSRSSCVRMNSAIWPLLTAFKLLVSIFEYISYKCMAISDAVLNQKKDEVIRVISSFHVFIIIIGCLSWS